MWDPWRDGTTKIFASAGRFSYALPTVAAAASFSSFPGQIQTYNFDPVSVVQDPNVLNHEEPVVQGTSGEYRRPGGRRRQGIVHGRADDRHRAPSMPTLTVGLKGTYRALNSTLEDRCDFDYTSPETNYSGCALINPGSNGKFASGDVPTCDGLYDAPEGSQCFPRGPASPEVKRIYRGLELFARQTVGNSLWLQASFVYSSLRGQLRRRRQRGRLWPDMAGHQLGLRLSGALARRLRDPRPRPALPASLRRVLDDPVAAFRGAECFRGVGRAAQPDGLFQ